MKLALTLSVTLSLFLLSAHAQQTDEYKFFDADWKPAKEKKAIYLLHITSTKEDTWRFSYYNMYGPLIRVETYQDKEATIRQGLFAWYDVDGNMDSCGYYDHGLRDRDWTFPAATPNDRKFNNRFYDKGRLLTDKELKAKMATESIEDPNYPDFSRQSPESYFPGGEAGWLQFINTNIHYPNRALKRYIRGTVELLFVVSPTGQVQDIRLARSVELSLDNEAIRIAERSPAWTPAIQIDRKVRSFKRQPIVFRLDISNSR